MAVLASVSPGSVMEVVHVVCVGALVACPRVCALGGEPSLLPENLAGCLQPAVVGVASAWTRPLLSAAL